MVGKPTRENNILDLIFSTEDNLVLDLTVGEKLGESDQYSKEENTCTRWNFRRASFIEFREGLRDIISFEERDVDQSWDSFKT